MLEGDPYFTKVDLETRRTDIPAGSPISGASLKRKRRSIHLKSRLLAFRAIRIVPSLTGETDEAGSDSPEELAT